MSALMVKLSVSWSPMVILPSAVILPVACMLPVTSTSLKTSTIPVPLGLNSRLVLRVVISIKLLDICKSSTKTALLYKILSGEAMLNIGLVVVIEVPVRVNALMLAVLVTSKSTVLVVPFTSKGY